MASTMYPTDMTALLLNSSRQEFRIVEKALHSLSLALIMAGTLLFNSLTIFIILRVRSLRQVPHNLLILNLAVADMGVVMCSMVFSLVSIFDNGYFLKTNQKVCMAQGFLAITLSFTNLPTIFLIAMDRLLILVFSRHFQPNRTRVLIMAATSWLVGVTVASVSATYRHATIGYHEGTLHCSMVWSEDESFRNVVIIMNYGFFVPSLLGCYALIIFHLWKEEKRLRSHCLSSSTATRRMRRPCAVTEDAKSTADVDASQGEGNGDWIFTHCAVSSQDRVEAYSEATAIHDDLQNEEGYPKTTNMTSARKNRLKVQRRKHMAHKRVAKMAILLVLAVVFCWTPYVLYHSKLIPGLVNVHLGVFTMWMAYCNALIDPLIYAFINRCIRAEMLRVMRSIRLKICAIGI